MSDVFAPDAPIIRWFNEDRYLAVNPDVAQAVRDGTLVSGRDHYERHGFFEKRCLGLLSRRERLLRGVEFSTQRGIEIGALMTPVITRADSNILFVDHADTATLRKKYTGDPNVDPTQIVPVDVVWNQGPLSAVVPDGFRADFVVASHVIEHVPDMIRWLNAIHDVLTPGAGLLRLAIPDRRFTFDILRLETRLHDLLDAYLHEAKVPTPHVVLDHCTHFRRVDVQAAWLGTLDLANLDALFSSAEYLSIARRALEGEYLDVHCWIFTPCSFATVMEQLCAIGLVQLACTDFHFGQPFENEFIVGLQPCNSVTEACASWAKMQSKAKSRNT